MDCECLEGLSTCLLMVSSREDSEWIDEETKGQKIEEVRVRS